MRNRIGRNGARSGPVGGQSASFIARRSAPPFGPHTFGATPWDDPEVYRRSSAITYVKTARTPT